MAVFRSDISDKVAFSGYHIKEDLKSADGRYRVEVFDNNSQVCVGVIEGFNGLWKVRNDPAFEANDLMKATKKAINNYLRFKNEFDHLESIFSNSNE